MKKIFVSIFSLILTFLLISQVRGQEGSWNINADLLSNYIWRGMKLGNGPAFQPTLKYTTGGFAIGVWGSICFSDNEALETDLLASYTFSFCEKCNFSFAVTDYFFPGTADYFQNKAHFFEPMVTLGLGKFMISGAYMSNAKDLYFETALNAGPVALFAGGGNGQYTRNEDFGICNLGLKTTRIVKITDSYNIPVSGSLILNPSKEQLYVVFGITI